MAEVITYDERHFLALKALWQEAFPDDAPWNAAETAIAEKLKLQPNLMLVAITDDRVCGSVMAGMKAIAAGSPASPSADRTEIAASVATCSPRRSVASPLWAA